MKTPSFSILLAVPMIISPTFALADSGRYATAVVSNIPIVATNQFGNVFTFAATNTIPIAEGEVGELISVESKSGHIPAAFVQKDGVTVYARPASYHSTSAIGVGTRGTTVAGPATFSLPISYQSSDPMPDPAKPALMTVRITPMTYAAERTVTVAPGMGNVQITMESSTNLVQWTTATNGVYSDDLKFFRIKLTK